MKHHLPGIDGKDVISTCDTVLCSFTIYVSARSVDYVSANLNISLGSISRLLKTLFNFQLFNIFIF